MPIMDISIANKKEVRVKSYFTARCEPNKADKRIHFALRILFDLKQSQCTDIQSDYLQFTC